MTTALPKVKTRSAAIDVLRVMAILAVAVSHLWGEYDVVRALTFSWHVPLFFFLSGYLWTTGRTVGHEARTRFRSLIVPFIAWTVILGAIALVYVGMTTGITVEGVASVLWGGARARGPWSPFWFLPVLFFATVLYRFLESIGVRTWGAVGIGLAGVVLCYLWGEKLALWTPQDLAIAVPTLVFIGAGALVRAHEHRLRGRGWWGAGLLLVAVALLLTGWAEPLDMKLGNFGVPGLSLAVSLMICTGLLWLATALLPGQIPGRIGWVISETAQTMVVILVTHTFFYFVLSAELQIPRPIVFAVTIAVTVALGIILHRTPLSPLLVGIPRAKATAAV